MSFTAENVYCFRDEVHLSLLGTRLADPDVVRLMSIAGRAKPERVLPAAAIFGANASGKSAILKALGDMHGLVAGSFSQRASGDPLPRPRFLLDGAAADKPSRFEVELILGGVLFGYGFEMDDARVRAESAWYAPRGRRALLFERVSGKKTKFRSPLHDEGELLERYDRENALLLSVAGAGPDNPLRRLHRWFVNNIWHSAWEGWTYGSAKSANELSARESKERLLNVLRFADLGIVDLRLVPPDPQQVEQRKKILRAMRSAGLAVREEKDIADEDTLVLTHEGTDGDVELDPSAESQGTQTWLGLIGPLLTSLDDGRLLVVDELDTSLHPHLVSRLVELFQSPRYNPNGAQLIFNTNDTSMLGDSGEAMLSRDQVWFTEKAPDGASSLYSLAHFTPAPRRDEAIERRYLLGRYGAIPSPNPADLAGALPAEAADLVDEFTDA
ncbi:AAA family ATPase [Candidatus Poriferisodalis sp.]|uniref:AAA family ATPase n=1 Tax=Candidatus Poriferisodalis sp. TaxID=3101277 RepID=UPI003B5C6D02